MEPLAGGSGHFADARSGFSYATNFAMGPCGTCADDDDGGGDEEADDAQMREKMAKDMVLVMLCERASLPASFNEITAKMVDVGWRRPPAQWQRVARELYEGETITVAQNSRGDIFEVWF